MKAVVAKPILVGLLWMSCVTAVLAGLGKGDGVKVTLRGVPAEEQQKVNGEYRVGESGGVRLPMIKGLLAAEGMNAEQFARQVEKAYRDAGIYANPAVEVEILSGKGIAEGAPVVSVGGHVNHAGPVPFRKGITLMQAVQAAGDRDVFGGRKVQVFRKGKVIPLDYRKQADKNFPLEPNDSISVDQAGILEKPGG